MSIEKIVRPSTQADISPPKGSVVARSTTPPALINLQFGLRGTVKKVTLTYSANASVYDIKRPTEKKL